MPSLFQKDANGNLVRRFSPIRDGDLSTPEKAVQFAIDCGTWDGTYCVLDTMLTKDGAAYAARILVQKGRTGPKFKRMEFTNGKQIGAARWDDRFYVAWQDAARGMKKSSQAPNRRPNAKVPKAASAVTLVPTPVPVPPLDPPTMAAAVTLVSTPDPEVKMEVESTPTPAAQPKLEETVSTPPQQHSVVVAATASVATEPTPAPKSDAPPAPEPTTTAMPTPEPEAKPTETPAAPTSEPPAAATPSTEVPKPPKTRKVPSKRKSADSPTSPTSGNDTTSTKSANSTPPTTAPAAKKSRWPLWVGIGVGAGALIVGVLLFGIGALALVYTIYEGHHPPEVAQQQPGPTAAVQSTTPANPGVPFPLPGQCPAGGTCTTPPTSGTAPATASTATTEGTQGQSSTIPAVANPNGGRITEQQAGVNVPLTSPTQPVGAPPINPPAIPLAEACETAGTWETYGGVRVKGCQAKPKAGEMEVSFLLALPEGEPNQHKFGFYSNGTANDVLAAGTEVKQGDTRCGGKTAFTLFPGQNGKSGAYLCTTHYTSGAQGGLADLHLRFWLDSSTAIGPIAFNVPII